LFVCFGFWRQKISSRLDFAEQRDVVEQKQPVKVVEEAVMTIPHLMGRNLLELDSTPLTEGRPAYMLQSKAECEAAVCEDLLWAMLGIQNEG
jgi:hypothetical protein